MIDNVNYVLKVVVLILGAFVIIAILEIAVSPEVGIKLDDIFAIMIGD